jgi:two-component system CitB family sensor kinase
MTYSIRRLKLKTRMILVFGLVVLIQSGLIGLFAITTLKESLHDQIAQRALHVAKTIAAMPQVIKAIETKQVATLPELALTMASKNDALFVVIGDRKGIRLAHPTLARIGQPMYDDEGDDNEPALVYGRPYTQIAVGSLGASMRGKAPIFNSTDEQVIGIVSVGFKMDTVQLISSQYRNSLLLAISVSLIASVLIALWFTQHFKKALFGLEPEQIGRLYQERNATLESVREGIIAINRDGYITTFNRAAVQTLELQKDTQLNGQHIRTVLPNSHMLEILETGEAEFDREIWLRDRNFIVNRIPLIQAGEITGVVSSFRLKDELDLVSQKLTDIQAYADSLRSQSHEYANKLQTIAGLIQIGSTDEALTLIGQESLSHQELIGLLTATVSDPILSGCLLGKYNRAKELGLNLVIDAESSMHDMPLSLPREQLVSVLSNIIDNAMEATKNQGNDTIYIHMTDLGRELIFEIEDQGPGISEQQQEQIFARGYSSKSEPNHGLGLHLVQQLLPLLPGRLTLENTDQGCRFTVYIEKRPEKA